MLKSASCLYTFSGLHLLIDNVMLHLTKTNHVRKMRPSHSCNVLLPLHSSRLLYSSRLNVLYTLSCDPCAQVGTAVRSSIKPPRSNNWPRVIFCNVAKIRESSRLLFLMCCSHCFHLTIIHDEMVEGFRAMCCNHCCFSKCWG